MALKRNVMGSCEGREGVPFATVEEAWIWYAQCQIARDGGARFVSGLGLVPRPCAPDDIAREVLRLHRRKILRTAHLRVMGRFAAHAVGPAAAASVRDSDLWREAADRLIAPLRAKGIVE